MKPTARPIPAAQIWRSPIHLVAFGFGAGLMPFMPGTWGTIVGVLVWIMMSFLPTMAYLCLLLLLTLLGIWICDESAKRLGVHDYSGIVWDEVVGFLWAMILVPVTWYTMLLGFALFRLFDIWKPWPIRHLDQKVGGGLGIMLDDIVAGIYAAIVLHIILLGVR